MVDIFVIRAKVVFHWPIPKPHDAAGLGGCNLATVSLCIEAGEYYSALEKN